MKLVPGYIEFSSGRRLPDDVIGFLRELAGPSLIKISGRNSDRCRLVVTLLHGNEPSGTIGCYRFLKEKCRDEGFVPRTDLFFFIANVELALTEPPFGLRQFPEGRDLNRCFHKPYGDRAGEIAAQILDCLETLKPEAVIDIHNTSGNGPSFAVCRALDTRHQALSSLFTQRVVITDLDMGALIDLTQPDMPVVTIECGGAEEDSSHQVAYEGILRVAGASDLFASSPEKELDIYRHPVRLELDPATRLVFAESNDPESDITLPLHIDKRNFGVITPDIPLGWVNNPEVLHLRNASGDVSLKDFFIVRHGKLHSSHPLKLFMVTTRPDIALSDCLLYAVRELDHSHLMDQ